MYGNTWYTAAGMYPAPAYFPYYVPRPAPAAAPGPTEPSHALSPYLTDPNRALPLILEAMKDERSDEQFYDYLAKHAPSRQDASMIEAIRNDERKHREMFRQIYSGLTGQLMPAADSGEPFEAPSSYQEGLTRAIMGESGALELYRRIFFAVPGELYKNMLFEIMTDEIKHGIRYNYLYAKLKKD